MIFNYWSFWNFNHFLSSYIFEITPYTNMLDLSMLTTSVIGGFMTYVYPRKIKYKNIIIKKWKLWVLDFTFHHFPLLYMCYLQKGKTRSVNALALSLPATFYILYLNYMKVNKDKIYGIKFHKLLYSSGLITLSYYVFPGYYNILYR